MALLSPKTILNNSKKIISNEECMSSIKKISNELTSELCNKFPIVITVMNGALIFSGNLIPLLKFPLQCDYIHATRYNDSTLGKDTVVFKSKPTIDLTNRTILILDDILDEGITMKCINEFIAEQGAKEIINCFLFKKDISRKIQFSNIYYGIKVPNKYIFGMGMDVKGLWRNMLDIYEYNQK